MIAKNSLRKKTPTVENHSKFLLPATVDSAPTKCFLFIMKMICPRPRVFIAPSNGAFASVLEATLAKFV